MSNDSTPPPPPGGGTPGWEDPGGYGGQGGYGGPGQGGYGGPGGYGGYGGGEHPEGQKLLIVSIVALLCCAPVNIWVLIRSNAILANPGGYDVGKVNTARIIAIVSLILWALGIVINMFTGAFSALTGM